MRIYIAGPYQAPTRKGIEENIAQARQAMIKLLRMGHDPFCPHMHTAYLNDYAPDLERETFLKTDLVWLDQCEALLMLPGWNHSDGSLREWAHAQRKGLLVFEDLADLPVPE